MNQQHAFARKFEFGGIMLAALLAISLGIAGLVPATAHASDTTTMWVVTKAKSTFYIAEEAGTYTDTISYTKNGLVKGYDNPYYDNSYTYDKKNRLKSVASVFDDNSTSKTSYKLDKKGRVIKANKKYSDGDSSATTYKYDSKGRLVKTTSSRHWTKYFYDSKNRVKKVTDSDYTGALNYTYTYTYNAKGDVVKAKTKSRDGSTVTDKYVNSYKNGHLVKVKQYNESNELMLTYAYTYKKVKVPKSLVKMARAQQASLTSTHESGTAEDGILPIVAAHKCPRRS